MTAAVFTEPVTPGAVAGLVFMRRGGFGGLCGHGLIAAVTIGLERGLLVLPGAGSFRIDTTAGAVEVRARVGSSDAGEDRALRVLEVGYRTPPVHVARAAVPVIADGRRVRVDVVWAHGWYGVLDREAVGLPPEPGVSERLRRWATRLVEILQPQVRDWAGAFGRKGPIDGIVFTGPPVRPDADLRSITVYRDGTIDRSPSGAGTAAVLALLDAMGLVAGDRAIGHEGGFGGLFRARVAERVTSGDSSGIVAEIAGDAWLTGEHTFLLDPDDPFCAGFET